VALAVVLTLVATTAAAWATTISGNIGTSTIEIDNPADSSGTVSAPGADLFPLTGKDCSNATFPTSGALDWVADCNTNTDSATLSGGIANGLIAGTTSASPVCNGTSVTTNCAKGHWNGVRVVDGISGNDQDIFLTGGKENDQSSWNVGPGTVGSSKYDASQMYLANNSTTLYFGMERIGNNGSTAFDFEFNKLSPAIAPVNCTTPPCYIPNRSDGDVLLTFEMSGSGSSGSAVAHYFTYNGTSKTYDEQSLPSGLQASINDATATAGEPWGHVDSKGNWALGSLDRFTFAEAAVPLSALGITGPQCGGNRFVEIRTRASAQSTSDLKDTTPIFNYSFGSPVAGETVSTSCATKTVSNPNGNPTFTVDGSSSRNATGGTTGLTYHFDMNVSPYNVNLTSQTTGVTLTKTTTGDATHPAVWTTGDTSASAFTALADLAGAGVSTASVAVKNTIGQGLNSGCTDSTALHTVNLYLALGVSAALTPSCTNSFTFSASATGGKAPYAFSWVFQIADATVTTGATPGWRTVTPTVTYDQTDHHSGTATVSEQGTYRAITTVTDTADTSTDSAVTPKPQCTATVTTSSIAVRNALTAGASKTSTTLTDSDPTKWSANLTATSNALAGDTITYQWQMLVNGVWTNITGATSSTFSYSSFQTDATPTALASPFTIGTDSYNGKVWSVQIRVHITRTLNGGTCPADSSSVTVKKVIGVDP